MATITSAPTTLIPGSATFNFVPNIGFRVMEEEDHKGIELLAGRVNGGVEYIFNVEFSNSTIPGAKKFTAKIPLCADSITSALAMLHVLAKEVKKLKDPQQLREMIEKLEYSAVLFDSTKERNGDYNVSFSHFNNAKDRFKDPHLEAVITNSTHKDLEAYAKRLQSSHPELAVSRAVHPELTVTPAATNTTTMDLTVSQSLSDRWPRHKEKIKRYFGTGPSLTGPELTDKSFKGFIDEVFGTTNEFAPLFKDSSTDLDADLKALCDKAREKIDAYIAALVAARVPVIRLASVSAENDIDAFFACVDQMIELKRPMAEPE